MSKIKNFYHEIIDSKFYTVVGFQLAIILMITSFTTEENSWWGVFDWVFAYVILDSVYDRMKKDFNA